ncbi:MAG: DEAD/DEAH box helicase [Bacteroidales bacterium]|nr:DEAD/DEAH box helicase [Bacteroidales bacterium]
MTFDDFNFHEGISDALFYTGFKNPTPIQQQAIPKIMEGIDLLATAQTGTGKTAAFMLPVLNKLAENPCNHIDTLVVVPTRELALQIDQEIQAFSYYADASSIAIYGGGDGNEFNDQRAAIKNGVNIIVATPGKLISHLNMGYVDLSNLKHFILDEADRMLDMGFMEDLNKIMKHLPEKRQNLMFSATMPSDINKLAAKMLHNHFEIKIAISKPAAGVKQSKYEVYDTQKIPLIIDIIKERKDYNSILIFTSTKKKVSEVSRALIRNKVPAKAISSDFDQKEREAVLLSFRSKKTKVLVATDVLSRGIDIKDINLVINYDVPGDAEDYVHRIGRTARAETKGEAITLVNKDDEYKMVRIERLIEKKVDKIELDKELGNAPNFKTDGKKSFSKNSGGHGRGKGSTGNNSGGKGKTYSKTSGNKRKPEGERGPIDKNAEGKDTRKKRGDVKPANYKKKNNNKPRANAKKEEGQKSIDKNAEGKIAKKKRDDVKPANYKKKNNNKPRDNKAKGNFDKKLKEGSKDIAKVDIKNKNNSSKNTETKPSTKKKSFFNFFRKKKSE